jgi:hypothetical protein
VWWVGFHVPPPPPLSPPPTALPGVLDAVRDAGFAEADVRVRAFRSGSLHQERTPGPTGSAHS